MKSCLSEVWAGSVEGAGEWLNKALEVTGGGSLGDILVRWAGSFPLRLIGWMRSLSPVLSRLLDFPSSTFDASTWRLLIVCRRLDWRCWTTEGPGWLITVGLGSAGVCCAWRGGGGACFASAPSLGRRWASWGPNTRDEEFKGFQSFVNNGFWARLEAWAVGLG